MQAGSCGPKYTECELSELPLAGFWGLRRLRRRARSVLPSLGGFSLPVGVTNDSAGFLEVPTGPLKV